MSASPLGARPVPETIGERAARSIRHPLARALLALTLSTGLVDAVSYLGLGRVFTANMTGNIVLPGFAVSPSCQLCASSRLTDGGVSWDP